jgi:probable F420-dependent oxidoreductase
VGRPFRFGIALAGSTLRDPPALRERARLAESLGYAVALVPDHLQHQLSPLPAMTFVAAATTRLRVGSFVFVGDFRLPGVLARELATLDVLSGGRVEVGLGAGYNADDYAIAGLSMGTAGERIGRLEETVGRLKACLSARDTWPEPVQQPRPPVMIGGGGRRLLSLAGREADIVSLAPRTRSDEPIEWRSITVEATEEKVGWVRLAAGERFAELELNTYSAVMPPRVTDDAGAIAREYIELAAARWPGFDLTEAEFLDSPHVFIGTADELAGKLERMRERFGISYIVVQEGSLDELAPVVSRLAGG